MSLITLFSAPKPFTDPRIALIQNNAISSWTRLRDVEVLLMGEERGLEEAAERHGVAHIRGVQRNDSGTPLISSMVRLARERSRSEILCIINADMMVMADFVEAGERMVGLKKRFVLVSRRWDLDVQVPIQFTDGWEERLRWAVREQGVLHRPAGSDFFLFPRMLYAELPPFAIGRAGWDNWMIYKARKEHWLVVDGTPSLTIVHQNHDYSYHPEGEKGVWQGQEAQRNYELAGGWTHFCFISDATHRLTPSTVKRNLSFALRQKEN